MANSKALMLVNKSIECMVSAIELYNKPDFKYREEAFSIMAINSWELLLKAKIVKDNKNTLESIYIKEFIKNKNGEKTNRWKYKTTHSGNKRTIEIFGAINILKPSLETALITNLELLIEIRNNSIHLYNQEKFLNRKIQEIGTASLKSYLTLCTEWFSQDLSKYNFYLMPLAFFPASELIGIQHGSKDVHVIKLLQYIAEKEQSFPPNPSSDHNVSILIEAKFVKPNTLTAQAITISSDPNAPKVNIGIEDVKKTHPMGYRDLTSKAKLRYKNFKMNPRFVKIRKKLELNQKYCLKYPVNPMRPQGQSILCYSPEIFKELDKHYTLMGQPKS